MNTVGKQLITIIERVERLTEERKDIADQIAEIFAEAKGNGFDVKPIKKIIAMRKQLPDERAEQEAILDTYMAAIGMIQADLFEAAE